MPDINTAITSETYQCGLTLKYRGGPFYGCTTGVGSWCWNCPCLRRSEDHGTTRVSTGARQERA